MASTVGTGQITVYALDPNTPVTVWRIVRAQSPDDPVFLDSLRSHFELSEEPRRVERSWAVLHMGISTYDSRSAASATAEAWPKLGDWLAQIELRRDSGFNVTAVGHTGHLTIWGDPIKLRDAVVDIVPVGT